MKSSSTQLKRIPWLAKLTGVTLANLSKCSEACINAFSYLGLTLLFTPIVSAAMIGYAVSTYCFKSITMYPVIFLIWTAFIYLFDRLVVQSDNSVTKWVRSIAIVILALFHSFIWDTIILKDDISMKLKEEYNEEIGSVHSKYADKIYKVQLQINEEQMRNDRINSAKRGYIDSLQAEGRGLGSHQRGIATIYKNLEKLKEEYKSMAESDIAINSARIADLKNEIGELKTSRANEIATVIKPEELGLMKRVVKMHEMVFAKGGFIEKLFFMIWFGLFCFLESLPLIAKVVFQRRLKEYTLAQDGEQNYSEQALKIEQENNFNSIQSELQNASELKGLTSKIEFLNEKKDLEMEKDNLEYEIDAHKRRIAEKVRTDERIFSQSEQYREDEEMALNKLFTDGEVELKRKIVDEELKIRGEVNQHYLTTWKAEMKKRAQNDIRSFIESHSYKKNGELSKV